MRKITPDDLMSLENYARNRDAFRQKMVAHKNQRIMSIGEHVSLFFEDFNTMLYQLQEVLRTEKIFEREDICQELAAYNPLIPDGTNWKATMMIEYSDVAERQVMLQRLLNIENHVWVQVNDFDKIYAVADEDMQRTTDDKTSAVHFLRFELSHNMIEALHQPSCAIQLGIDHPAYQYTVNNCPSIFIQQLLKDISK